MANTLRVRVDPVCTASSLGAGEPVAATATATATRGTDRWLLIEYRGAWGKKAVDEAVWSDPVRRYVETLAGISGTRIQLIRQHARRAEPTHVVYVACASASEPRLWRYELASLDALVELPVAELWDGQRAEVEHRHHGRLIAVCSNGKRDVCCSTAGTALFGALSMALSQVASERALDGEPGAAHERAGDGGSGGGEQARPTEWDLWHTTHIGGHRFAPTLVMLPEAISLGRVSIDRAAEALAAWQNQRLFDLATYRGCAAHSSVVQSAEHAIRERTGELAFNPYRVIEETQLDAETWRVRMGERAGTKVWQVELVREVTSMMVANSCGEEPKPVIRYAARRCDYSESQAG